MYVVANLIVILTTGGFWKTQHTHSDAFNFIISNLEKKKSILKQTGTYETNCWSYQVIINNQNRILLNDKLQLTFLK